MKIASPIRIDSGAPYLVECLLQNIKAAGHGYYTEHKEQMWSIASSFEDEAVVLTELIAYLNMVGAGNFRALKQGIYEKLMKDRPWTGLSEVRKLSPLDFGDGFKSVKVLCRRENGEYLIKRKDLLGEEGSAERTWVNSEQLGVLLGGVLADNASAQEINNLASDKTITLGLQRDADRVAGFKDDILSGVMATVLMEREWPLPAAKFDPFDL